MKLRQFLGPWPLLAVATVLGGLLWGQAGAMDRGPGFEPPSLDQFILIREDNGDGDGDGIKETHILRYRDLAGDSVFSMTTDGILWAWSMEGHRGATAPEHNYVIRDSDCDGTFDERYSLEEQFHVPECAK
jgi:hypothetical protein